MGSQPPVPPIPPPGQPPPPPKVPADEPVTKKEIELPKES
jgi:hypothetical protein